MMCWRSYVGMLVLIYDASAIRQDSNLFLPEEDSKDLVVPVCHQHTLCNWLFSKSHHLTILSDSIKPWPMTLAPTNEAIRRETMQKKTQRVKKVPL
jgi:hypothetical protein